MDEQTINEITDRVVEALNNMAPGDPTGWEIVAALGPLAVLAGGVITLIIGMLSLRRQRINAESQSMDNREALAERRRADDRAEWWKRAQWALDASFSESTSRQELGFKMLDRLTMAANIDQEDLALLDPAWRRTAASSSAQAETVLEAAIDNLQDFASRGLIGDDYLKAYRQAMDDQSGEEHNGSQTSDGEGSDERNSRAGS